MKVLLDRYSDDGVQTLGRLYVVNDNGFILYECDSLELPWRNNKPNISCIPQGKYKVVKRRSPKYDDHFHIQGVENRSYILIHPANFVYQLRGCIAVGMDLVDINSDDTIDITNSKNTVLELLKILPSEFFIEITNH